MKRVTTTYTLRLTFEAPVEIPRDVIEAVLDNSTAFEAIEEGVWNWLPLTTDDENAENAGESIFDAALTIVDDE